jgi:spermidine synthase
MGSTPQVAEVASAPTVLGSTYRNASLFLISLFGLFLELLLIRWIGTEIRVFGYMQNAILVVCFMGLGMGCWTCEKPFVLRQVLQPLLLLTLISAFPITRYALSKISLFLSLLETGETFATAFDGDPWRASTYILIGIACAFFLMVLVWEIFVPVGRLMARLMNEHPRPILAYSINVGGALVGIWSFVLLSVFSLPPVVWFGVAVGLALCFLSTAGRARTIELALLAGILGLATWGGLEPDALEIHWSPYQKLTLLPTKPPEGSSGTLGRYVDREQQVGQFVIMVNNGGYQALIDLSEEHVRAHPDQFPAAQAGLSQYDLPSILHPHPKKVLIVGAGSGNDVSGALRHPIDEVTAVEIDPAIIDLGRRLHAEQPYQSPRVRVVNDDARSFFATDTGRYDVISFGLLDSHTTTAMMSERLDHYVYTRESLEKAKSLLADGGVLVMSFEVFRAFSAERMNGVLREVFGRDPLRFRVPPNHYGWGGIMMVAGNQEAAQAQIDANPRLKALIAEWNQKPVELPRHPTLVTDDWPYIYLEHPSIPLLYAVWAVLLVLLFWRGLRRLETPRLLAGWQRTDWHFFFLGAAFLLLEVQNISKAAVALGNTWRVNAVIISGILGMILLANAITARFPRLPLGLVYAALLGICLGLYFVDLSAFGGLPYAAKALVVGLLTSLPMLFSGIIFIRSFAHIERKDQALGANLMGSLVGGLLQAVTFVSGVKFLLLLVAVLYLCAFVTRPAGDAEPAVAPKPATA